MTYIFGASLVPLLVGLFLSFGFNKYILKVGLIVQWKIVSLSCSLILLGAIIATNSPLSDSANVVVSTISGFFPAVLIAFILKARNK